jgi:hypothetical protein
MTTELSTLTNQRQLPESWVTKIFATMQGHYGTRWLNMWRIGQTLPDGQDAGVFNAMSHWAEKLGGYVDHPKTIKRVLENLPPDPPSLPQFAEMLRQSHVPEDNLRLPHTPTETEREKNKGVAKQAFQSLAKKPTDDGRDWARQILANPFYDDGRPRSPACIKIAQKALGL